MEASRGLLQLKLPSGSNPAMGAYRNYSNRQWRLNEPLPLLTLFSLTSGDFWFSLGFSQHRSIFSTCVGGYKNTAIAEEKKRKTQKSSLIRIPM